MNTFSHPRFRLGWALFLFGIIWSAGWTLFRLYFENHYTQTQITLDIDDTRSLSDAFGVPQEKLLADFKARGATSIAIYDQNLTSLRDNGRLAIVPRETAEASFGVAGGIAPARYRYFVTSNDRALLQTILPRVREQSPNGSPPIEVANGFLIPASRQLLGDASLGFDPAQVVFVRKNGFLITPRVSNALNLTPARLERLLKDVKATGAKTVIFSADEVLGYETLISNTARLMRNEGLVFSNIEFSKQRGAPDFAKNTEGMLVRVHSVQGDEASRTKPEMMVDRFVRAAKERNMRVLYIRLLRQQKGEPKVAEDPRAPIQLEKNAYEQNLEFIEKVSAGLQENGFFIPALRPGLTLGEAQPFGNYPEAQFASVAGEKGAKAIRFLMLFGAGLGVVGATFLLLNLFYDWSDRARLRWLILGIVLVAALSLSAKTGAKVMGLMAGITVSTVAVLWGGLPLIWDGLSRPKTESPKEIAFFGFKVMAKTTLLTLAGAFLVIALFNNWLYMSKADEFMGEKATQFLPLLIVPFAFLGELFPHRVQKHGARPGLQLALARVNRVLTQPFNLRIALTALVVLAVGYVWMARFGNESGMEISSFELQMRATLEKVFATRPRTKEIAMGMPTFLVVVALMLRRQRALAWGLLFAAMIGQTDVLNSMCHIHTPVFFCIWRSLMGILIGGAVGIVAVLVFEKYLAPRFFPKPAEGAAI